MSKIIVIFVVWFLYGSAILLSKFNFYFVLQIYRELTDCLLQSAGKSIILIFFSVDFGKFRQKQ